MSDICDSRRILICSLQRRYRKVTELAPVFPTLLALMLWDNLHPSRGVNTLVGMPISVCWTVDHSCGDLGVLYSLLHRHGQPRWYMPGFVHAMVRRWLGIVLNTCQFLTMTSSALWRSRSKLTNSNAYLNCNIERDSWVGNWRLTCFEGLLYTLI